jgi:CheY-like chemotaxis protein
VKAASVALVVHDPSTRRALAGLLSAVGLRPLPIASGLELISRIRVDRPRLVVIDRDTVFCDPIHLVRSLALGRAGFPVTPSVVLSSSRHLDVVEACLGAGAVDVFTKPIRPGAFAARLKEIVALAPEEPLEAPAS